ncbi:MAG: glycine cleavage system transcriptional repressor [Sulfuricaulis sp.]
MKKYFVISALGKDRPGIVNQLSKTILDSGCNIEDSRMTVLGGEFALILMVSGHWGAITRLERQLPLVEKKIDLTILARHTESRAGAQDRVPYTVDVVAMDHPGIVNDVADFFASREINVEEMSTWTYAAAHTATPMFALNLTVSVPSSVHIGRLRDEFTAFCDNLNLDATLEPARN